MKKQIEYISYGIYNKTIMNLKGFKEKEKKSYARKKFISAQKGNDKIAELLKQENPFMIARYGAVELAVMRQCEEIILGIRNKMRQELRNQFHMCAGFFPNDEEKIFKFFQMMREDSSQVDLFGTWFNPMENYFIAQYNESAICTPLVGLEPWYYDNPWSEYLKEKKVLVVHPFEKTIQEQYNNRMQVYPNGLLPKFKLSTVKAVQTIAGENNDQFSDWFEALEYMFEQSMEKDFDIAIIGCGAYGFPLAAKIKREGKQAIHLGGATQLLFGIKGKRWDEKPEVAKLYNDFWCRPSVEETVKNKDIVEGGCYW